MSLVASSQISYHLLSKERKGKKADNGILAVSSLMVMSVTSELLVKPKSTVLRNLLKSHIWFIFALKIMIGCFPRVKGFQSGAKKV